MRRRLISILLTMALVLGLLPAGAVLADTSYDVWIGNTKITSANCSDVFGDGTVSYDNSTQTLTLNNASIDNRNNNGYACILSYHSLNITGTGTITQLSDGNYGVRVKEGDLDLNCNLTINIWAASNRVCTGICVDGTGKLTIHDGEYNISTSRDGIETGSFVMDGGVLNIESHNCIDATQSLVINDGSLNLAGDAPSGTYGGGLCSSGYISINGGNTVVYGDCSAVLANGGIFFNGGSVNASTSSSYYEVVQSGLVIEIGDGMWIKDNAYRLSDDRKIIVTESGSNPTSVIIEPIPDHFTVSFNSCGGTGTMEDINVFVWGDSIQMPECTFVAPEGMEFDGWSPDGMGISDRIEPGTAEEIYSDRTFYARWKLPGEYRFTDQPHWGIDGEGIEGLVYDTSFVPVREEYLYRGEVEYRSYWYEELCDYQVRAWYGYGENDYVDSDYFFGRSTFDITIAETENGTVTVSDLSPEWGSDVVINVSPADGYELMLVTYTPFAGAPTEITSDLHFTMPMMPVTINAYFREITAQQGGGNTDQPSTEPGGGSSQTPDTPSNTEPSGNGSSQSGNGSGNSVPTPAIPTDVPINVTTEPGVAGFVERLYTVALGRASDPVGKQDWIDAITLRGETGASAARGFLYSPEFLNKDCSNEEFVTVLYSTFFDRTPDNLGFTAWVEALNTGASKEQVIEGFINSTEWANLCLRYGIRSGGTGTPNIEIEPNEQTVGFATRLYTTCLNREADEAGLMAWARQLANQRDTGTGAARGFFFSSEFTNQNVDNGEYVTRLYRTFMGREPDEAGFNAWVAQLDAGVSREEVFNGFAESPEFTRICSSYGIIR